MPTCGICAMTTLKREFENMLSHYIAEELKGISRVIHYFSFIASPSSFLKKQRQLAGLDVGLKMPRRFLGILRKLFGRVTRKGNMLITFNPFTTNIKEQILLSCLRSFLIKILERSY